MNSAAFVLKSIGPKLVPFFKTLTVYFVVFIPNNKPSILATILKCLPILSLMLFVILHGMGLDDKYKYPRRILIGLIFCCIGDALLIWPGYFMIGMCFFAVGHIHYILALGLDTKKLPLATLLFAMATGAIIYLLPGCKGLLFYGVPIYTYLLTAMLWRAFARINSIEDCLTWSKFCAALGALLFVISDILLGINAFRHSLKYGQVLIMVSYYAAQLGISLSVVDFSNELKTE